jgi:nucleoside-diphosphate-sugar epimerase
MIFISSIKVNGERTTMRSFREDDEPHPEDEYGRTKLEAERVLRDISEHSGMESTVLRPPLMYGAGVKGNILSLLQAIDKGWPLPLGSVKNRRSLLYVGNLVSAIMACLKDERSAGRTYLLSDGPPVSTPELVCCIAGSLGRPARLIPFSPTILRLAGKLLGKADQASRLTGSLEVDASRISHELGWNPPYTLEQGMAETARWFRSRIRPA